MYLFIINPSSGNGQAVSLWKKVESILRKKRVHYEALVGGSDVAAREFIWKQTTEKKVKPLSAVTELFMPLCRISFTAKRL